MVFGRKLVSVDFFATFGTRYDDFLKLYWLVVDVAGKSDDQYLGVNFVAHLEKQHQAMIALYCFSRNWFIWKERAACRIWTCDGSAQQERKSQVLASQPNSPPLGASVVGSNPACGSFFQTFLSAPPRVSSFFLYFFLFRSLLRLTSFFLLHENLINGNEFNWRRSHDVFCVGQH